MEFHQPQQLSISGTEIGNVRASNRLRKVKQVAVLGDFLLLFHAKGFVSISLFLQSPLSTK